MTPLNAMPRDTARPPGPRGSEDHDAHLSGGARYASAYRMHMRPRRPQPRQSDRARSWRAATQDEQGSL
jgi:hypothetical protein